MPRTYLRQPVSDRIMARVLVDGDCWLWQGALLKAGYGKIDIDGRTLPAHRVSYEIFVGEISEGLQIDHLCRKRSCVNPSHLEPVSPQENVRRGELASQAKKRYGLPRSCISCRLTVAGTNEWKTHWSEVHARQGNYWRGPR